MTTLDDLRTVIADVFEHDNRPSVDTYLDAALEALGAHVQARVRCAHGASNWGTVEAATLEAQARLASNATCRQVTVQRRLVLSFMALTEWEDVPVTPLPVTPHRDAQ